MTTMLARLEAAIARHSSALVAYSGGIDSALIAVVTHRILGPRMLAVTSRSPSLAPQERDGALHFATEMGFPHRFIETQEMANPQYVANGADRCYHCKTELYGQLHAIARAEGFEAILNGTNLDDLGDYRPGLQAAKEHMVTSPFIEAEMSKADVRTLAQELGLSIWDKPAAACLASRLPYGTAVTLERLDMVGQAERSLQVLGFSGCRVRHHGDVARIELPAGDLMRALEAREAITLALKGAGYRYVTLDLEGYRVGSLNEAL